MPLYKTITVDPSTKALVWKVEEPYNQLSEGIELTSHCQQRVDSMKSEIHRRGFMSIRHLMAEMGYEDKNLFYDKEGKPHLTDNKFISITHSFEFTGIIVSQHPIGIDIEKQREKILKIAHKFTPLEEYHTLANEEALIRKLTIVWGAKESIYKLLGIPGLLFLHHINVKDFNFEDRQTTAKVNFHGKRTQYHIYFSEFEGYTCVYAFPM